MMRWLIWRDVAIATRTPALWWAAAVYLGVLAAFVTIWGSGVPAMSGTVFDQFARVQWAALVLTAPWVALRATTGGASDVTVLAALAGASPGRVVTALWLSLTLVLCGFAIAALPMMAMAADVSASGPVEIGQALAPIAALCLFVAAVTTAYMLTAAGRLWGWLLATATTLAASAALPAGSWSPVVLAGLGGIVAAAAAARADRTARYLVRSR